MTATLQKESTHSSNYCARVVVQLSSLTTLDHIRRVESPRCSSPEVCVCVQMPLDVCECVCSLVLYSLCHTEYWLGGRWLNGSCLALLVFLFYFNFSVFYFLLLFDIFLSLSSLTFASRGHSAALAALPNTFHPLTPADNANCPSVARETLPQFIPLSVFSFPLRPPSSSRREAGGAFFLFISPPSRDSVGRPCMGCRSV